jgi:hypothetical protein
MAKKVTSKADPLPELAQFSPVTLAQLEKKSNLLDRLEHKYIVPTTVLREVLRACKKEFRALEHAGTRAFTYESTYFDDGLLCYWHHHQGRRLRCKVRSRLYVDSDLCFLELKLKGGRGSTDKRRILYEPRNRKRLTAAAQAFVARHYEEAYGKPFTLKLKPAVTVRTTRVTLVADGERVTIDTAVEVKSEAAKQTRGKTTAKTAAAWKLPDGVCIVETKTPDGHGRCDRILRAHGVRPVKRCSKYCIGVAHTTGARHNRFNQTLRIIERAAKIASEAK